MALLDHLAAHAGMGVELEGQQQQWEWKFELQREQQEEDAEQPEAEAEVEAQESGTGQPVVQGAEKEGEERKGPAAGEEGVVEQGTAAREEGEGEQEGREGQQSDEGEQGMESEAWDGSSGLWRVAKEEVRLGKITRVYKDLRAARDPRITVGPTGLLKSYHTDIVCACLGDWTAGCHEMVADAGLPARPHPVLQAQHACRAAEALCRLYRGQGLGGAYGPEPSFDDGAVEVSWLPCGVAGAGGGKHVLRHLCTAPALGALWYACVMRQLGQARQRANPCGQRVASLCPTEPTRQLGQARQKAPCGVTVPCRACQGAMPPGCQFTPCVS